MSRDPEACIHEMGHYLGLDHTWEPTVLNNSKSEYKTYNFMDYYNGTDLVANYTSNNQQNNSENEIRISDALKYIQQTFIGKPYTWGNLDCSGLVSRYSRKLNKITPYDKKDSKNSDYWVAHMKKTDQYFVYIKNSKNFEFKDIKPGDFFLWSRGVNDGHVGIVLSYNKQTDVVKIIEAIHGGAKDERDSYNTALKNNELTEKQIDKDYYKKSVRISYYPRTSLTLNRHDGWQGYFRPKIIK